jgi:hypothetical protein
MAIATHGEDVEVKFSAQIVGLITGIRDAIAGLAGFGTGVEEVAASSVAGAGAAALAAKIRAFCTNRRAGGISIRQAREHL